MTDRSSRIEVEARRLWLDWGRDWSRYTACHACGQVLFCGAARRAGPFLCVDCFDTSRQAVRMLKRGRS
jgi:hypothetical protein